MKNRIITPLILGAVLILGPVAVHAAPPTGQASSGLQATTPIAPNPATQTPRMDTLNPEAAPPVTPSGTLNPEVAVPSLPLVNDSLDPTGAVPSVPAADPSEINTNPNPQSQVSPPAGTPVPGETSPIPDAGGQPAANVKSGMHAPALGPKTGGAAQVTH